MRSRRAAAAVLVACVLAACQKGPDAPAPGAQPPAAAPAPTPAKYAGAAAGRECKVDVLAKGDGREVKSGDTVLAHFSFSLADGGKTLIDTRKEGDPQPLEVGSGYTMPALDQAILKMRVGDRWKIAAPWQLAYGEQGYPPMVPPKADMVLDVEIVGFLEIKTEVLKTGSGPTPMPDDYVLFHDVGTLPDGKTFEDTRAADSPMLVTMGVGKMIQGWFLTLRKMKVGDRWKVSIPWRFAYGAAGRPPIVPPKTDVVFDIERLPLPEIKTEVLKQGKGELCAPGQTLTVHYVGTLLDGTKFDSSRDKGEPLRVALWARPPQVIAGWELVLAKMRVGDRWKATIPWQLAYGAAGRPPSIAPRADLVFDIEVLDAR